MLVWATSVQKTVECLVHLYLDLIHTLRNMVLRRPLAHTLEIWANSWTSECTRWAPRRHVGQMRQSIESQFLIGYRIHLENDENLPSLWIKVYIMLHDVMFGSILLVNLNTCTLKFSFLQLWLTLDWKINVYSIVSSKFHYAFEIFWYTTWQLGCTYMLASVIEILMAWSFSRRNWKTMWSGRFSPQRSFVPMCIQSYGLLQMSQTLTSLKRVAWTADG